MTKLSPQASHAPDDRVVFEVPSKSPYRPPLWQRAQVRRRIVPVVMTSTVLVLLTWALIEDARSSTTGIERQLGSATVAAQSCPVSASQEKRVASSGRVFGDGELPALPLRLSDRLSH